MLLHQKMKLQRKENALTLKQMQFSSKVDRMQKKVDKRQKYFDKLKKQLERQANCYKNSANIFFSNQMGLGTNSVNMQNYYGMSEAAYKAFQSWGGKNPLDNGKSQIEERLLPFVDAYFKGMVKQNPDDTKQWGIVNSDGTCSQYDFNEGDCQTAQKLLGYANSQVSEFQNRCNQMKLNYENNVSIWLEAEMESLEAREEYEMDMLAEEQADMEAEKNSVEVQLQRVQEEKKNIEQALGNAIQDSAPKFGLA